MEGIIIAIRSFLEAGGDVLYLIAAATFVMWALIFERMWFINTEHKQDVGKALAYWEGRPERNSWHAHMIRLRLISEVNVKLQANMSFIKTLISLLPLLGLLGTVTGMVQVFEAMTYSGGNARSMAAGVSAATIPTMSGMVATLSGVLANTFIVSKVASEESYMEDTLTMDH
ncbi:MAG: MotA/TolQ/ExbB proton channel family protein [Pseudomonadales bacterium]|nr:MotA/TolQ/ExbB proton channel family protein [Pseudomonadales bacterium]MBO6566987.1 MotA/TolQ/ExbB proton channel family protein [Pseudomonadales bacterium]MBO6595189.1 MotA/TolQ/ExbB proton channel family protein [Pseudomonadales bacterium]MBO6656222.1 MotA/TolQ/ExbB proton channel family protein [Pseudomonadales bacterium]MBO6701695.1 MotA/TolQ/ExbB proton channel family protein [Pseudomonadales bacterium]